MKMRPALSVVLAALVCGVALHASDDRDLAATTESQRIQNERADADDLSRMTNDAMVRRFRRLGLLLPVASSTPSYYLSGLPARFHYLRPWSRLFLKRLSLQFHERFGARLRVTGLVRSATYQTQLDRRNPNAATAAGPKRSSHLTGATLDVSKRFMSGPQIDWMRDVLSSLNEREVVYALEEFSQPCFHVMVHKSYTGYVKQLTS